MERCPKITIGMPTFNRALSLPTALNALKNLDYPKDKLRIVFVDNKSADDTPLMLRDFKETMENYYENVIIVSEECNIPEARNLCVNNSIGKYILFIDSDIVAPSSTIKRLLELFELKPQAGIIGLPRKSNPMTLLDKMDFSEKRDQIHPVVTDHIGLDCTMIRKELFDHIGLFDPRFFENEDMELSMRAKKAGYISVLDPSNAVLHLRKSKGYAYQIIWNCFDSYHLARYRFMILQKYKPKWMINRLIFYTAITASIPLATMSIIAKNAIFALPLIMCYGFLFLYNFPKNSGKWKIINPTLRSLWGTFFVVGTLGEIFRNYLVYPCMNVVGRRKFLSDRRRLARKVPTNG